MYHEHIQHYTDLDRSHQTWSQFLLSIVLTKLTINYWLISQCGTKGLDLRVLHCLWQNFFYNVQARFRLDHQLLKEAIFVGRSFRWRMWWSSNDFTIVSLTIFNYNYESYCRSTLPIAKMFSPNRTNRPFQTWLQFQRPRNRHREWFWIWREATPPVLQLHPIKVFHHFCHVQLRWLEVSPTPFNKLHGSLLKLPQPSRIDIRFSWLSMII